MSADARAARLWNARTMTMTDEERRSRDLRRIQRLIAYAYEHSSLHRRLYDSVSLKPSDVRSWDDFFHRVPSTDKPDYLGEQETERFAAQTTPPELEAAYFHTSGTTGSFLRETYSEYDALRMATIYPYAWWDAGVRSSDSIFLCFNFGAWLGLWHMYWGARHFGMSVYSGGGLSSDERIDAVLEHQPTMVAGTPTYLLHLLHRAREREIDLSSSSVRFITAGGEPGMNVPVTRAALEAGWGAVGIDAYGLSEVGIAHVECGAHPGGVHVIEDAFHAYAADPTSGESVPDGELGENVVTSFTHFSQPFVKYRTHDIVRYHRHHEHGCGWNWGFLEGGVLGRTDYMVIIRGVNVFATAVENLLGSVDGLSHEYQIHVDRVEGMDTMLVKVEAAESVSADAYSVISDHLLDTLHRNLGVRIDVEICTPSTLPRFELKATRILDHRDPQIRPKFEPKKLRS